MSSMKEDLNAFEKVLYSGKNCQKRLLILVLAKSDVPELLSLPYRQQDAEQCLVADAD